VGLGYGGGIYSNNSNPTIEYNIISGNESDSGGAGIVCNGSGPTTRIAYNTISENLSHGWCGGLGCVNTCTPEIINNTFYGNKATRGAGFVSAFGASPILTNNIFWADSASVEANEIYIHSGSPTFTYCDIEGGWGDPEDSIINADPLFVDPDNGDFHLTAGSPCIDAGCPDSPNDPDGSRCDMGAYWFDQVGIDDFDRTPRFFALLQNYPNPFNVSTVIRFDIPQTSQVIIHIYDLLGRKVETLIDGNQPAGSHSLIWDAEEFSSGVYFYKLKGGNYTETRKMVLIK